MTYQEIENTIDKILWGKSIVDVSNADSMSLQCILRSLTIKESNLAQYLYNNEYRGAVAVGIHTNDELNKFYIDNGLWSNDKDLLIEKLKKQIKFIKAQIKSFEFQAGRKRMAEKELEKTNKELDELVNDKLTMFSCTAENRAEEVKRRYIVSMSSENIDEQKIWPTRESFLEERDSILIYNLALAYYKNNIFDEKTLRLIARSSAWRYRWNASKNGLDLFGKPIAEWSEMQKMIIYWSQYYDYVFEHPERPNGMIVEDDAACDSWVDQQSKQDVNKQSKDRNMFGTKKAATKKDHQEQFIMVDPNDKESVQKLKEMNSPVTRAQLSAEYDRIKEKGRIKEWDLRKKGK